MALIWLAAVILELSSRSRPPTEKGRAPVEQGMDGGRLAGPLRAEGLGLWGEMGLKVWYYSTAERACWQSWRGQSLVSSPPWAFNFLHVVIPACVRVWVRLSLWQTHTHTGVRRRQSDHMLKSRLEEVHTKVFLVLKMKRQENGLFSQVLCVLPLFAVCPSDQHYYNEKQQFAESK